MKNFASQLMLTLLAGGFMLTGAVSCKDKQSNADINAMVERRAQQKMDSVAKADSINKLLKEAKSLVAEAKAMKKEAKAMKKEAKAKATPKAAPKPSALTGTYFDRLASELINAADVQDVADDLGVSYSMAAGILRNSIYARHGRFFVKAVYRDFFNQCSWYHPYRKEVPASELNSIEQRNIAFLK